MSPPTLKQLERVKLIYNNSFILVHLVQRSKSKEVESLHKLLDLLIFIQSVRNAMGEMISSRLLSKKEIFSKHSYDICATSLYFVFNVCRLNNNMPKKSFFKVSRFLHLSLFLFFVMTTEHQLINSLRLFVHHMILVVLRNFWILF